MLNALNHSITKESQLQDPSLVFYFSYALSLKDVIQEIEQIGVTMKTLFGEDEHIRGKDKKDKVSV